MNVSRGRLLYTALCLDSFVIFVESGLIGFLFKINTPRHSNQDISRAAVSLGLCRGLALLFRFLGE